MYVGMHAKDSLALLYPTASLITRAECIIPNISLAAEDLFAYRGILDIKLLCAEAIPHIYRHLRVRDFPNP
jgi:hypothetical protein